MRTLPLLLSHLRKLETFSIQGNPFQDPFNAWAEREAKSSSTQELGDAVEKEGKREEKKGEGESEGVLIGEENHRQISLRLLKKFKKIPEQWLAIYTAACRGDRIIIQDLLEEVSYSLSLSFPSFYVFSLLIQYSLRGLLLIFKMLGATLPLLMPLNKGEWKLSPRYSRLGPLLSWKNWKLGPFPLV